MSTGGVTATDLPSDSALLVRVLPGDFLDCYAVASDLPPRAAAEIIAAFPGWVRLLLRVRGAATAPFGLLNDGPDTGNKVGPFPVEHEDAREVIAGFDDRHLDFRVCVHRADGRVHLATWVRRHNLGGRLYLTLIYPFHVAIARDALRRVARS